nr:ribonuclease H-like domain-containing protein [Tanacetum cinerariifolium]
MLRRVGLTCKKSTDHSITKEVIKNGNKVLKRTVRTVEQIYEPTFVEEKLERKNEMKARGALLMALPNKDQLKFYIYQNAKFLMEAIKKRYGGNKESKKDHQAQAKIHKVRLLYPLTAQTAQAAQMKQITLLLDQPNSSQHAREDLEQINLDDLEEMDLHWEIAMLTIRARRSKVECFNCHKNGHFARECKAPKNQENRGREYGRKTMPVENPNKNALISQDGIRGESRECKSRSDKGYHAVPPPYTGIYIPHKPDLTFIDEQVKSDSMDVVSNVASSDVKTVESKHKSVDVKIRVEFKPKVKFKTIRTNIEKIAFVKTAREKVEKIATSKQNKHYPRGNQRNWNNLMSQRLGSNFKKINKACFVCGSFEHFHYVCGQRVVRPVWNNTRRVNHKNFANKITNPHSKRRFVPHEILTKSGKLKTAGSPVNTIRPVNTVDSKPIVNYSRPISNAFKRRHSQVIRPYNKYSTYMKTIFNKMVNTVRVKDINARERAVVSEYMERETDAVKASACWVWKAKRINGKGRIFGKGKIKTGKLDFDYVYFGKELKYNLFNVSQMCDKKNNVLFTNTECLVLSSNFKLLDESQVLLRVPRKDNIYSVDLKSVLPIGGLTCLFAKAIIDESNLWHRRLGHINYKTMNKLNGVAKRKNITLIEAARTMLVYSKLPTTFWGEAVNTACCVLNKALVIKPYNKTPNEVMHGRPPLIDFMKPFGCSVTILNTRVSLGKSDGKTDEGFFVGYSVVSKDMRVFNKRTRIVEVTLNIIFIKIAPNVKGNRPDWLFDIYSLTISINYEPVVTGKQTNGIAGTKDNIVAGQDEKKKEPKQEYILIPIYTTDPLISQSHKDSAVDAGKKATETEHINSTNSFNIVVSPVNTAGPSFANTASPSHINAAGTPSSTNEFEEHPFERFYPFKNAFSLPYIPIVTPINDTGIFSNDYDEKGVEE